MPNPMNKKYINPNISNRNTQIPTPSNRQIKAHQEEVKSQKETSNKPNNDSIFEIFGIKLYFDDILLICLIFFLYNEGVQDQYLFIALILLLLS